MFTDFTKGFGGEPDFDWRGYAEWLLQALNAKTGQAWILEQENLRLKAEIDRAEIARLLQLAKETL